MITNKVKTKNTIIVAGTLSNTYTAKNDHLLIRIKVNKDEINAFVPHGDLSEEILAYYKVGDRIVLLGNIQSSNLPKYHGRPVIVTTIFGEELLSTRAFSKDSSDFIVEGTVNSFIRKDAFTKVFVETNKNDRQSLVPIVIYGPARHEEYSRGDLVKFKGTVQVRRQIIDGVKQYFQNYVASD